jgi:hypothetical protein
MTTVMTGQFSPGDPMRFAAAIRRFDEENSRDPNTIVAQEQPQGFEVVYAQWLTEWVLRLCPGASEELRLAARCQHLCRWAIPRNSYPMDRTGYLRWRTELKQFHAEKAGQILREVGYPEDVIQKVQSLNLKKDFPHDPEGRVLEDALCLVFLEHQFGDLAAKTTEEKLLSALQKAWKKMTPQARAAALALPLAPEQRELIQKAVSS